ncbi:uncharacterized protein LOC124328506 [Daphnia pulicaria]|uniref:uncharacterized protein LOC124328506 n=1 Tax=Daphnia pulicaria TaxID=35523 RepID=UPI001EE9E44E|nr:uncharacterized protein LOC124328506 [Daphnia pulicaria]XP_046643255.1 uncharacterized protein LOC124328506 [Daphnia pulicaria]
MKLAFLLLTMAILASSSRAFILPGTPEQTNIANEYQTAESAEAGENQIAKDLEHFLGKPLTTMSFAGTTRLNIYRVQGRKNYHSKSLYQFSPAAILDSSSITHWYSGVNSQLYFGFRVQMWNETIQQAVATHLTRVTGKKVRTYQVESIPFDRVILTRSSDVEEDGRYHMAQPMIPYTQTVGFSLACYDKAECQQLAEQFSKEPEQFDKFKVAYSMDSRRETETKIVQVTQSMLTQTNQLFSQISQRFPRTNEILLSVGDAQRLLWRAISDIVRESFGEQPEAIVRRDSRQKIYDQLEKVVVAAKLTISTADDAKWPTVYWEDPLSRPDAIARSLNERKRHLVHHDDDNFDVQEEQQQQSSSDWKTRSKEAIDALYDQHKEFVSFDGEKFVPKPIQLYRIKLNAIREGRVWKDLGRLEVNYHAGAEMTGPIIHSASTSYSLGLVLPASAELEEEIPNNCEEKKSVISRLIDGQILIVRIKNARTGEYLYPGRDEFSQDAKRRRVFTWRNKDEPLGLWAEWRLTGLWKAGVFRVRFTSLRFPHEYLYPSTDEFSYDKDRRRVFTWRQYSKPEDVHTWADGAADWLLDTYRVNTEQFPNRYALFSPKRREYLYVAPDQLALDETRHRVFTWRGPENEVWVGLKNQWDIEVVRSL